MASNIFTAAVCVALLLCAQEPATVAAKRVVLGAYDSGKPPFKGTVDVNVGVSTRQYLLNGDLGLPNLRDKPLVIKSGTTVWFTTVATVHDFTFFRLDAENNWSTVPAGVNATALGIRGTDPVLKGSDWVFANGAAGIYSVSRLFTVPGTYKFHCQFHRTRGFADMLGTIIVKPKAWKGDNDEEQGKPALAYVQAGLLSGFIFFHARTRTNLGITPLRVVKGTKVKFVFSPVVRVGPHNVVFDRVPYGVDRGALNSPGALVLPTVTRPGFCNTTTGTAVAPTINTDIEPFLQKDHVVTLTVKGEYTFFCIPHQTAAPGMTGTIFVV